MFFAVATTTSTMRDNARRPLKVRLSKMQTSAQVSKFRRKRAVFSLFFVAVLFAGAITSACSSPPESKSPRAATASATVALSATAEAAEPTPPPAPTQTQTALCQALEVKLPELNKTHFDPPMPSIETPDQQTLRRFYNRWAELARGKAKTHLRIAMYGDSNLTNDAVSGELRRTLQQQFGDGGHGFHALAKPWPWYRHLDVKVGSEGWKGFNCTTDQLIDRRYGHSCVCAQSQSGDATTWIESSNKDDIGGAFSSFDLLYLRRPKATGIEVRVDGQIKANLSAQELQGDGVGKVRLEFAQGPHRVEVKAKGQENRLLGAAIESATPGVVVDGLGVGGATTDALIKADQAVSKATLQARQYDLVILFTGALEPDSALHRDSLIAFIEQHRAALPNVALLILAPPDMAHGTIEKPSVMERTGRVSQVKKQVAMAHNAAFWDFRAAMGGDLSIVKFAEKQMAWTDFTHLTEKGGQFMGRRLAYALVKGLKDHMTSEPKAGCEADETLKLLVTVLFRGERCYDCGHVNGLACSLTRSLRENQR